MKIIECTYQCSLLSQNARTLLFQQPACGAALVGLAIFALSLAPTCSQSPPFSGIIAGPIGADASPAILIVITTGAGFATVLTRSTHN